jgi:asparagine synthase (glutamine-hydrolysing)
MNIFAIAWNLPKLSTGEMHAELLRMADIHQSLDTETLWGHRSRDGLLLAASISGSPEAVSPRKYVCQSGLETTFYCGLPVDPENACAAHDACDLAAHWGRVAGRLEGTYSVARLSGNPTRLEIQTDLLGGEAVYYTRIGDGWFISNSVLLIERLTNFRSLDPLGVSMYLHLGHALGNRTLRQGIHVIGAAQRWTWDSSADEPKRTCYYPVSSLAGLPRRDLNEDFVAELATKMQQPLTTLAAHFDSLICPLTGGKDSRLIASLLINANLSASYFTFGDPGGDDSQIAKEIADRFGLPYEIRKIDEDDVVDSWERTCLQTVRSTDGMRSLYLLAGMSKKQPISRAGRDIHLWGACGEVARSFFGNLPFLKSGLSGLDVKEFLNRSGPSDRIELVSKDAIQQAKKWRDNCVDECLENGIAPLNVPDIYGNHFVDARRLSNNGRGLAGLRDTYTPFASRAFLEACFSLAPIRRYTEPLHYRLLELMSPELHRMPFAKNSWRLQNPMLNLVHMRGIRTAKSLDRRIQKSLSAIRDPKPQYNYQDTMFERLTWFESKRVRIRELALDDANSSVWDYVNRTCFEQITSANTGSEIRSQNLQLLFHVATLLYYESDPERAAPARDVSMDLDFRIRRVVST